MKFRIIRKNKKRRDPRYFLHENLELDQDPGEEFPPTVPELETSKEEDTREPYEKQMDEGDQEGAVERMLIGVDNLKPLDWELVMRLVVTRAQEYNERYGTETGKGRDINLEKLLQTAQGQRS